jgi:hypothetical protein
MATTTFAQIKARVVRLVLEDGADVTAEIPQYVRDAQAEIEDDRTLKVLEADFETTLASGASTLTKPSDWNSIRLEPYLVEADFTSTKLSMITEKFVIANLSTTDTGAPKYWREISDTQFRLYPIADALGPWSDDYKVKLPYWKRLDTLTADADTNWFCDNAENYLIWFAAALGMELNDDPRFIPFFARAKREKARIEAAEARGRMPTGWTLKPDKSSRIGSR